MKTRESTEGSVMMEYLNTIGNLITSNNIMKQILAEAKFVLTHEKYADDPAIQHLVEWMNAAGIKAFPSLNWDV